MPLTHRRYPMAFVLALGPFALTSCFTGIAGTLEPTVSFAEPADGATVTNWFIVRFTLTGDWKLAPAGSTGMTGHHHLIVDQGSVPKDSSVPFDTNHIHYGLGQDVVAVQLPPGTHQLTAQFADSGHISFGPTASKTITVNVLPP
jgi:Domain of unknown function (DUF4399)